MTGLGLADQIRNLDWHVRRAEFIGKLDLETMAEILARLRPLVELEDE